MTGDAVAEQAETSHIGQRMDATQSRKLNTNGIELRGGGDAPEVERIVNDGHEKTVVAMIAC